MSDERYTPVSPREYFDEQFKIISERLNNQKKAILDLSVILKEQNQLFQEILKFLDK